eukprot:2817986-Pleurochrysis_carterae.AAC.3
MWEVARDEWMASDRPFVLGCSRRRTCHSNSPPRRMKGRNVRSPLALGGSSSERTLCASRTVRGMSPTATQGRGSPSTPETDSVHGRTLIISCTPRAYLSLRRPARVAINARALDAMQRST